MFIIIRLWGSIFVRNLYISVVAGLSGMGIAKALLNIRMRPLINIVDRL